MIKNKYLLNWIETLEKKLTPYNIIWIDGSENQNKKIKDLAIKNKTIIKLNEDLMPGCYLHRSKSNDVARVEDRTFICSPTKEEVGETNNWWDPNEALELLDEILKESYKNKTMYIIPFCMGPIGSEFAKYGVEVTDSEYVALSMSIMTKCNQDVYKEIEKLNDNWVKCLHSTCDIDPEKRYVCHFPQDNLIISVNSNYGGNALLAKKCMALRLASNMGKDEGWLAEHMLILGIKTPYNKDIKYLCAAFPSGCGKTNLALIDLPQKYKDRGYQVFFVGDDIAWIRIGKDKKLYAVNAENGIFGVCHETTSSTNPNALKLIEKDTIFTNVGHDLENNTVWWEGLTEEIPENIVDWQGKIWNKNSNTGPEHKNSRFSCPVTNCQILSKEYNNKNGVPISAIIFGGKDSDAMPLICESFDWNHGLTLASNLTTQTTPAIEGKQGVIRNDPFAMKAFCGYDIKEYFGHWRKIGEKLSYKPKIFYVNWFKQMKDEKGETKGIWPGFGENIRVLDWILKRCNEEDNGKNVVEAKKSNVGYLPCLNDLDLEDLNLRENEKIELFKFVSKK